MPTHGIASNHHAGHRGFSGLTGLLAAFSMVIGRGPVARLAADLAAVDADDRVVDVGCGPGTAAREATRRGASVTGVDPAPVMLRVAGVLTTRRCPLRWIEAVAEALPLPDDDATVMWSLATVHHWDDVGAGLREARRVLRPGGRLLAIERRVRADARGLASHGWTPIQADTFAGECRDAGFVAVEVTVHDDGRKALLAVRAVNPR
jgi:ubiquinone/menaquinone biosynthesis C-methylase UbiE